MPHTVNAPAEPRSLAGGDGTGWRRHRGCRRPPCREPQSSAEALTPIDDSTGALQLLTMPESLQQRNGELTAPAGQLPTDQNQVDPKTKRTSETKQTPEQQSKSNLKTHP